MYAVRTEPGKERIRVRSISSGFLPSYSPAPAGGGRPVRRFVVPGVVFTLVKTRGAEKVPEEEWQVIEALSDPKPSAADEAGNLLSGPLKAIAGAVSVDPVRKVAVVRASLLGEERRYEVAVEIAQPDGNMVESEAGKTTGKTEEPAMAKKSAYTGEQKAAMVARAEEIGVRAAAKEYGVAWQVVAQFRRRAAEAAQAAVGEPKAAVKAKKKAVKEVQKTAVQDAVTESAAADEAEALRVENAVLREQVASLTEQVARLKKALAELL